MMLWVIILFCALALAVAVYAALRGLAAFRNETGHAWSQIEAQLKHRRELVHEFLARAAHHFPHAEHLRDTLSTQHQQEGLSACAYSESRLTHSVGLLLNWIESCPEEFIKHELGPLCDALSRAEEKILFASQYHNAVAKAHNTRMRRFPYSVIARCFGIKRLELFELEPDAVKALTPALSATQCVPPSRA